MHKIPKAKLAVGFMVVSSLLALCFIGMSNNSVYFYTPKEVLTNSSKIQNKIIRMGGMVKSGSVIKSQFGKQISFVVSDLKGSEINVNYKGSPPDLFKENAGVVIEGRMLSKKNEFKAHLIMAKHSEEYRVPNDPHREGIALLEKSIIKNENNM